MFSAYQNTNRSNNGDTNPARYRPRPPVIQDDLPSSLAGEGDGLSLALIHQ